MKKKSSQTKPKRRSLAEVAMEVGPVGVFIRKRRKMLDYTQPELAERSGVSLNFVKAVELGKATLRMDKVNLLLGFFGAELKPISKKCESETEA